MVVFNENSYKHTHTHKTHFHTGALARVIKRKIDAWCSENKKKNQDKDDNNNIMRGNSGCVVKARNYRESTVRPL